MTPHVFLFHILSLNFAFTREELERLFLNDAVQACFMRVLHGLYGTARVMVVIPPHPLKLTVVTKQRLGFPAFEGSKLLNTTHVSKLILEVPIMQGPRP